MIFHAIHYQHAAGLTGTHIETGTVDRRDYIVVFDVVLAVGIAVTFLSCVGLIQNTLHLPTLCGVVVVVIGIEFNILTRQISRCQIVNDLLTIGSNRHFGLLIDARGKVVEFCGKNGKQIITAVLYIVTCQLTDIVSKGVADSFTQCCQIVCCEITGVFQSCNDLIGGVGAVNRVTQVAADSDAIHTVIQEVIRPILHRQILGEILHQHHIQAAGFIFKAVTLLLDLIHQVQGIHITDHIQLIKTANLGGRGDQQIILRNIRDHFL